ncbi:UDP-N-acetylglucosamine 1-carboxyvinyltransferase [Candidatus Kaiserbacteria bacterium RIFCSPHIGHO2_02_FULL_55_17]|uniref:UDP-N-acetylglucosamine 1-carboxyvinyltransferase n=1 Tax=Candidatus Kaiserbacteria bacterium RIFCSPHIGHO2_02_FULL_55_17 TaxID=1798496 RepID=A0A1F6DT69_9BACT|nr:MAG: UDP-N-acetylglucosamine 1-carboxyvinyltransferase [Candidatus Kaiserbacteria bacterium RIFCSPHIGHO2_02_FULL_55_17]
MQGEMNFIIEGGKQLSGRVETSRSKNGAVALLAASLLNRGRTTLLNVPKIEEVNRLIEVLRSIGVSVEWFTPSGVEGNGSSVIIEPPEKISLDTIDTAAAAKTRSILMFIGPLLHLFKEFELPQSGGCTLGTRSVRPHLMALEKFGVTIETRSESYRITHAGLHEAEIILYESSDTATINALLAAARIAGTSVIKYASANYQVQEVCGYLRELGVSIEGIGSTTLTIHGVPEIIEDVSYSVAEDPTDAMFFISAAAVTGSAITIANAPIEFLEVELFILEKMGLKFELSETKLSENGITKLKDISIEASELTAFPEKIHARPYPGLNIDNLPFFAVIATQAKGATLIHDWVYEKRAIYYTELDRLGAVTNLHDPHRISITGPTKLKAAEVICPPALRPATIILVGMLAAKGRSVLRNVYSINRGYEDIVHRLQLLGASIEATN